MKFSSKWLIVLSVLSLTGCPSTDNATDEAGTMTAGTMTAGTMTAGTMTAGTMVTAGTMTAGAMTGGTMVVNTCTDILAFGATCDVFNDCCARGTACVDLDGEGDNAPVCLRKCDANADVDGCEARELCNPESGDVPAGEPSPGTCIPGDDCVPGSEMDACGAGEYYCQRIDNITLCIGDLAEVRAQAPDLIVGVGEECNPFDQMAPSFCEPGLVCEYGTCRASCNTVDDCAMGEECLDYTARVEGLSYKFCIDTCDVYAQDCGEGKACVLTDTYDGQLLGTCIDGVASGAGVAGEACTTSEQTYWGTCTAGHICSDDNEDGMGDCVSFCDTYHLDRCSGDYAACVDTQLEGLGLCSGECDVFTNAGCAEGQSCLFGNEGTRVGDVVAPTGFCYDNALTVGEAAVGAECQTGMVTFGADSFDYPFLNNCPAGNICLPLMQGAPGQCFQMCNPDAMETGCEAGVPCRVIFDGIDSVGVCFAG